MAFSSYGFLLAFFPAALVVYYAAARFGSRAAAACLCAASLAFCAAAGAVSLVVLLGSALFNFAVGRALALRAKDGRGTGLLAAGIAANVALLAWCKYAGFVAENLGALLGGSWSLPRIPMPLGISFLTFTQIMYLVEASRGETREAHGLDYGLFVSLFPKLVAGPIAEPRSLLPQLASPELGRYSDRNLVLGFTLLSAGLFKKVIIADELGSTADRLFATVAQGAGLSAAQAWIAALAYTLQLYFDFSGYSDMALGAARCFGIVLPQNFHSPYQATSISDFWRRWHMTLSRFLTRYLYTPLAAPLTRWAMGRGCGPLALFLWTVALPTLVTFALAGLWHGAGWTFVVFGTLHGLYLCANQGWRELRRRWFGRPSASRPRALGSWALTFTAVLVAFVFFRASSVEQALALLGDMLGAHGGLELGFDASRPLIKPRDLTPLALAAALAWLAPNLQQWLAAFQPALDMPRDEHGPWGSWAWRVGRFEPHPSFALLSALLWLISLAALGGASEFIYYQF